MKPINVLTGCILALLLFCLLPQVVIRPELRAYDPTEQQYAIVAGVSDYSYIGDTRYGAEDAIALGAQLKQVFGPEHVTVMTDEQVSKTDIENAIRQVALQERANDLVVIYLSGHGTNGGHMLPFTGAGDTAFDHKISPSDIDRWLDGLDSTKIIVILDYCLSGDAIDVLSKNGRVVMTCGGKNQSCWETDDFQLAVFTHYILDAFTSPEKVDANNDYNISAEEIFDYAKPKVSSKTASYETFQIPQIADGYPGELTLFSFSTTAITFDSEPYGIDMIIDGELYSHSQMPLSFDWMTGTVHNVRISESMTHTEKNFAFDTWSDGNTSILREVVATQSATYTARFKEPEIPQHMLTIVSEFGETKGQGLYDANSTALISVPATVDHGDGIRHKFDGWSFSSEPIAMTTPEATIRMTASATIVAHWEPQYYLNVDVMPAGLIATDDEGWYDASTLVPLAIHPQPIEDNIGAQYRFHSWHVDGVEKEGTSISIVMNSPHVVEAHYKKDTEQTDYSWLYILIVAVAVVTVTASSVAIIRKRRRPKYHGE